MKHHPIVFTTLLVLVLLTLPAGSLYVSAQAGKEPSGIRPLLKGTEPYSFIDQAADYFLQMPLILYSLPPENTPTPTATSTSTTTPTQTSTPTLNLNAKARVSHQGLTI